MDPFLLLNLVFAFILGSLIGSFSNVLIHRLPIGENIAFPASHCPKCNHKLGVLDLVPIFSWLSLGGRCRYCRATINPRYPIIELITAIGYTIVAWFFPIVDMPVTTVAFWALFTVLLVISAIDIETYTIPDVLTFTALGIALVAAFSRDQGLLLPDATAALEGMGLGAGLLALIAGLGAWVLRRFREPSYPDYPVGYMQIHVAALVGAWFGPVVGVSVAVIMAIINRIAKKVVPIPDFLTLGGLLVSLVVLAQGFGPGIVAGLQQALFSAGVVALLAGVYWAVVPQPPEDPDAPYDPVAMGFGDVKLMGVLGAVLGWQMLLIGLAISVVLGAVLGILQRLLGGDRQVPFGPYLAAGAVLALVVGPGPVETYLRSLGL
jgi:leader peptidase (prepilin peptidase) / N-methyltransferase